jgi:hypothetical protein
VIKPRVLARKNTNILISCTLLKAEFQLPFILIYILKVPGEKIMKFGMILKLSGQLRVLAKLVSTGTRLDDSIFTCYYDFLNPKIDLK